MKPEGSWDLTELVWSLCPVTNGYLAIGQHAAWLQNSTHFQLFPVIILQAAGSFLGRMNKCVDSEFPCPLLSEAASSLMNLSVFPSLPKRGEGLRYRTPAALPSSEIYTILLWSIPLFMSSRTKQDAPEVIHSLNLWTSSGGHSHSLSLCLLWNSSALDKFLCTLFSLPGQLSLRLEDSDAAFYSA